LQLPALVDAPLARDAPAHALAHGHHAACSTPAVQPHLAFDHLTALSVRSAPVDAGEGHRHSRLTLAVWRRRSK